MPSIQAHMFRFVLEHRHLLRFQHKRRAVFDFNTSIPDFREDCEKGARLFGKLPEGIDVTPVDINGIPAEWIQTSLGKRDKLIVYVHGGGYVSGSCSDHRAIVARIVKSSGVTALLFEYRLAPEHPYPAAIDDAVAVYRWLLGQGFSASDMMVAGESAGGGLALALLLALRDLGIALPAAAVAISPWTDLACTSASYRTKNAVSLAPLNSWTVFSKYYTGDMDPRLPWISPLYGELHDLPPLLINAMNSLTMPSLLRRRRGRPVSMSPCALGSAWCTAIPFCPPSSPKRGRPWTRSPPLFGSILSKEVCLRRRHKDDSRTQEYLS
ncbi:alpha/beta hydrolase fold domain-containing protein [Heliomicrobium undosum]|uniref:alpha/beta hydrolase fold domain-containing protein n=1 Tax=Heliomicrobium undosum TaxID=121734 RepID=UPI001A9B1519|nr:alpha/beta hydrolase fold domain-containing protein [Heliomicrobium undosum]